MRGKGARSSIKSKNSDSEDAPILVNMGNSVDGSSGPSSGSPFRLDDGKSHNSETSDEEGRKKPLKSFWGKLKGDHERVSRTFIMTGMKEKVSQTLPFNELLVGVPDKSGRYPKNAIRNQKYTTYDFLFIILFNQVCTTIAN